MYSLLLKLVFNAELSTYIFKLAFLETKSESDF